MMTWRVEPEPEPVAPRKPPRQGVVRVMSVAVASLIMANGVVVAEYATGRDLAAFLRDGVSDARGALSGALDPEGTQEAGGEIEEQTTSTTAATAATPDTDPATTASSVPASGPGAPAVDPAATPPVTTRVGGPAATTPASARPAAAAPETTEQAVARLSTFVSEQRGLPFNTPVAVAVVDDATFRSRLDAKRLNPALDEARRSQGVMRALGIIEPGVDLAAQVKRLSNGSSPAFYDAEANELVVRRGEPTPFSRKIIVHELAQALHDQHFELHRPELRDATDETGTAFNALTEGTASRIEERYVASLTSSERSAVEAEQKRLAAQIPRDLPQVVLVSFGFPFTAGLRLANALAGMGGNARFDDAFRNPPSTSEQVVHPERFASGEGPKPVAVPAADGAVIREGTLGQLMLSLMLAEVLEAGYAEGAADGWGGDRYVAWEAGGQTCVRLAVEMDNPDENAELTEALTEWAADTPGATVEGTGPVTVTRCG